MMVHKNMSRYSARRVESRQAGRVLGPCPHPGPPKVTGGHPPSKRGARLQRCWGKATGQQSKSPGDATRPLRILQWNCEGVYNKKLALAERLKSDNIDVACLQETHLNPTHRFSIRGYEAYRMDREGHKGGVLILVRNSIPCTPFTLDTDQQSEIHGVSLTVDKTKVTLFNLYCPDNKHLSLSAMEIPSQNSLIVGDFNSHSTSWGYNETDRRGDEVEDWAIENSLILLNDPEDSPTFFSRRWLSTTTPDLAFATEDLSQRTDREVRTQLAGSDHKPVLLTINLQYRPAYQKTFPRWNYKKADWELFSQLSDEYTRQVKADDYNINRAARTFTSALLKAASETIPRGARKNYRPYWSEELQELEDEVTRAREKVEANPTIDNNITFKASSAKYKRTFIEAARTSWRETTEKLNFDRDGHKLWKLAKTMNSEESKSAPLMLEKDQELLTGRAAANCLIDNYEQVSNLTIPATRKHQVHEEMKNTSTTSPTPDLMNKTFNIKELNTALKVLQDKKSPGPDKITNEMLKHMGPKTKTKLLALFNNGWKSGHLPQSWREADMVPIHKKGKDRKKASSYRPISLTSCVGKLLERMINSRLVWHLESNNIITPEQAGFRKHRSTEDQVTYIAQKIEDGFQDKHHTLAVWIDLEKAYDKVWKEGLRLKLRKNGVSGCMYEWISQYLTNRRARVHVNGAYSRKKTLREGVPQGGVLSPTLFLIFINDIISELPRNVQGAIYADDLVLWCAEEHITTATYRIQQVLNALEKWTQDWLVKINANKTTYTIFSLSTKEMKANLHINGTTLEREDTPTYLGVTFDKRLTWKQHTEKSEIRGKLRLALMKKLAGTTWGADATTLKTLYTGSVRPVLEYGVAAWGNTAKSNFDRVSKVQNQATRIITGAMRSTPIQELETTTGLQSLEDRRDSKILTQAAKFKRLATHPMRDRLSQSTKGRLKRTSFIHQSRALERQNRDLLNHETREIPSHLANTAWSDSPSPHIQCSVPGVGPKDCQNNTQRRALTLAHVHETYPPDSWTQVYTDGSAEDAVRNGGAGIFIEYPGGRKEKLSLATGRYSTNFRAEAVAIKSAADHLMLSRHTTHNIVFLSDALSVLQALDSSNNTELNDLSSTLASLCTSHNVTLQWIPAHCGIRGNEEADSLAKEGTTKEQLDGSTTYSEEKTLIKAKLCSKWQQKHPRHNRADPYFLLTRKEQVCIFRLRTGHNRLNHHMFTKLKIGETASCPCGNGAQTTEHLLQSCPLHATARQKTWPNPTALESKLFGGLAELQATTAFVADIGVTI